MDLPQLVLQPLNAPLRLRQAGSGGIQLPLVVQALQLLAGTASQIVSVNC